MCVNCFDLGSQWHRDLYVSCNDGNVIILHDGACQAGWMRTFLVMHSYIWFVHRSTPAQDVILGLLRNCSNRGGVFYYNIGVFSLLSYFFAQKRKGKNCVCLLFSADNGSMPTISSGPQNQQSFEVFFLMQNSPQKCNKCHDFSWPFS